jgi:hypothetical protein
MRLLDPFRSPALPSHFIFHSFPDIWQAPVNQGFSFLIGVFPPSPPLDKSI